MKQRNPNKNSDTLLAWQYQTVMIYLMAIKVWLTIRLCLWDTLESKWAFSHFLYICIYSTLVSLDIFKFKIPNTKLANKHICVWTSSKYRYICHGLIYITNHLSPSLPEKIVCKHKSPSVFALRAKQRKRRPQHTDFKKNKMRFSNSAFVGGIQ